MVILMDDIYPTTVNFLGESEVLLRQNQLSFLLIDSITALFYNLSPT